MVYTLWSQNISKDNPQNVSKYVGLEINTERMNFSCFVNIMNNKIMAVYIPLEIYKFQAQEHVAKNENYIFEENEIKIGSRNVFIPQSPPPLLLKVKD